MSEKRNYTIIRLSGRTEYFPDADYYGVLGNIYHEHMSAGSNWDRPNMLLMNGKVVVSEDVTDIAWKHGERNRQLHNELRDKLRKEFQPDWLKGDTHAE